jgi:predicted nucleic acid-binding protein
MIVLDASALVDVVLDQPAAAWVLDQVAGEEVSAPAHQPAEVLSAVTRLVRARELAADAARDALDEAMALPHRLVRPTAAHLRRAYALREGIRVLDGLYVVLADELGCALVTTDRRLAGSGPPCEVRAPRA